MESDDARAGDVTGPGGSRRAEALMLKRERILEEATRLFYIRGFERTTIDAIADRFGMTKPAVYYHFDSKAKLLDAVCLRVIESCIEALEHGASSGGTAAQRMERALRGFVTVVIRMRANTAIFFREVKHLSPAANAATGRLRREFDRRLANLIDEGVAEGSFDARDARFASLAIGGMVSWLYTWYRKGGRLPEKEIIDLMVDAALRMVGAKRALLPPPRTAARRAVRGAAKRLPKNTTR